MRVRVAITVVFLILFLGELELLFSWTTLPRIFSQRYREEQEFQELKSIPPDDWSAQTLFWQRIFRESQKSPDSAYKKYVKFYKQYNEEKKHTAAHMIGGVIYEIYGKEGFAICDSNYAFGCFHELFSRAVGEHGVEVVADLDKACIARWGEKGLGCQHGIGHALLAALGDEKMQESLRVCGTLNWQGPIGGCTSGVFMEHNFGTVRSQSGFELRKFDKGNPFFPCDAVTPEFQEACYFEQPAWWWQVSDKDIEFVDNFCADLKEEKLKRACFWGLGHILANGSSFQVPEALRLCGEVSSVEGQEWCKEGNAWGFFAERDHRLKASSVCQSLKDNEQRSRCLSQVKVSNDNLWIIGQE